MIVPMNDLSRGKDRVAISKAIDAVIASGWYLNGKENEAFCEAFASRIGVARCFGVANGTDALQLALLALRWRRQEQGDTVDEVVTVANAGGYTSTACHISRCVPVYVDIEAQDQLMSISAAVAATNDRTLAVVATHLYGGLVDVPALRCALDAAGYEAVDIIEDCAQAHGLNGPSGTAGSLGNISTFSFYPTKNLGALGDGGAVATDDAALGETIRRLQQYGWSTKYEVALSGGMNSRLDEMQAAALNVRLVALDEENVHRIRILDRYAVVAPEGVRMIRCERGTVAHLAVGLTEKRDELRAHLRERGVVTDVHYPILDIDQPGWSNVPSRTIGDLKASRTSVPRLFSLPCFPSLMEAEVDAVCDALASFRP